MAQKPNNLPIIIAVVAAIGGVVMLNVMQQRMDPKVVEQEEQEREQKAAQAKQQAAAALQQASKPAVSGEANEVAVWGPKKVFGKVGGLPKVVIGWQWTPTIQGDPSKISDTVDALQKAMPGSEVDAINIDAQPKAAPLGISIDGAVRVAPLGDGTYPPPQAIGHLVTQK